MCVEGCEMVKVRRMTRARLILLITGLLLASVTSADASFWKRSAAPKAASASPSSATATPPAGMSLTAIDVETSPANRLILRTSASPVYTSYSLSPDAFVIDLTGTSKAQSFVIPTTGLPASVASVSVEEVSDMGLRLTRVTLHLTQPVTIEAAAEENSILINLPAGSSTAVAETAPAAKPEIPASIQPEVQTTQAEAAPAEVKADALPPIINDPTPQPATTTEPAVVSEALPAASKAKTLRKIETTGTGQGLEVRIATDGDVDYNAFSLKKPSRAVFDLSGVNDKLAKNIINVSGSVVKRIRVSQFKSAPTPVTRVVLDLDENATYHVTKDGGVLHITFDNASAATAAPTPVPKPEQPLVAATPAPTRPAKVAATVPAASADIPAQVPTIAESSVWKMPETPKRATAVINAPQGQTPPTTPRRKTTGASPMAAAVADPTPPAENVFSEPQPAVQTQSGTLLSTGGGSRTLSGGEKAYTGEPLSLTLKEADIKDVLHTFQQLTGLNIAVDPQVTGLVTVDFVDIPWDQALEIILRQNGLAYILEGNVMRVGTAARLADEAEANRRLEDQKRLNVPLETVGFKLSYARSSDVAGLLRDMASPRARIIVDARTNQLIISEIPIYLQTMRNLIESVDVPTRQVVIEARIVETTKTFAQSFGFNWGFHGTMDPSLGTGTGLVFPNRVDTVGGPFNFGAGNPVLSFTLQNVLGTFNLDLALLAAESEGLVRVISAPRIMTQDNTQAEIQSGFQIPYQTRVNFTTTVSYVDATLRLSVTPQITEAGTVIMDIQVQKNEPDTGLNIVGGAGTPLSTRRAQTKLMVRDGGTTVIAGIYQVKENNGQTRLPFLHQIPVLGALFRTHDISSSHDELLIFITPRIVRAS
ncbi:MAG: type pilus assembly protein PilQ [Thermoanaerobaculia bacterium]|nr:type pilus assembly protein PilQ [Thermoanaerobaculia bacterium]